MIKRILALDAQDRKFAGMLFCDMCLLALKLDFRQARMAYHWLKLHLAYGSTHAKKEDDQMIELRFTIKEHLNGRVQLSGRVWTGDAPPVDRLPLTYAEAMRIMKGYGKEASFDQFVLDVVEAYKVSQTGTEKPYYVSMSFNHPAQKAIAEGRGTQ